MVARLKDTQTDYFPPLSVKREGFEKLVQSLSSSKKPPSKLVNLMKGQKPSVKK